MPLLVNFALEYTIRMVQVKQDGLKLNDTRGSAVCTMSTFLHCHCLFHLAIRSASHNIHTTLQDFIFVA
jgi:hypothetical protein